MDEEARAAQWRQDQQARVQWERDNAIRLRGSDAAATALKAAWQPVIDWQHERYQIDPDPVEYHDRRRWSAT